MNREQKALETVNAIQEASIELQKLHLRSQTNVQHWDAAMTLGDGIKEHQFRQEAHALLDQMLDLKQRVLQLVKAFEKL